MTFDVAPGEREGVSSKEADAHLLFALMQVRRAEGKLHWL